MRLRICINRILTQPRGPNSAVKLAATTTVGKINGIVLNTLRMLFPGKVNLANRYAAGIPTISVNRVEMLACHIVKRKDRQILNQKAGFIPSSAMVEPASRRIAPRGKK